MIATSFQEDISALPRAAESDFHHQIESDVLNGDDPSMELKLSDLEQPTVEAPDSDDTRGNDIGFDIFTGMLRRALDVETMNIHIAEVVPLFIRLADDPDCQELGGLYLNESTLTQLESYCTTNPHISMSVEDLWGLFRAYQRSSRPPSEVGMIVNDAMGMNGRSAQRSMLPRPKQNGHDGLERPSTPPRPTPTKAKTPPSFGRKRTTPIMSDGTTARRAFGDSIARSTSSEGGLVGLDGDEEDFIEGEEFPERDDMRASPIDPGFSLSHEEFDAPVSGSFLKSEEMNDPGDPERNPFLASSLRASTHRRIQALTTPMNGTPRRTDNLPPETFHTPMTTIRNHALNAFTTRRLSPTPPTLNGYGSRESPQTTVLKENWSPMASTGSSGPASAPLTPRSYRTVFAEMKKHGLPEGTFKKMVRREPPDVAEDSSDTEDGATSSEDVSRSEFMRITQVAIDMAKRMKTKDEELVKFQEVSEHQLSELQGRIDELHSELNEKRRHIALLNVDDRVQKSRIDALESDTHRLQSELSASKRLCAELKKELEERKEINLELTTDLKWKENEVNMTKVSLTGMEEELKKGEREKRKLEESVEMLRDHLAHAEHLAQLLETENHDLARTVRDLKDNVDEISSHTNAITHGSSLSYLATSKVPMPRTLSQELDSAYESHTESAEEANAKNLSGGSPKRSPRSRVPLSIHEPSPIPMCSIEVQTDPLPSPPTLLTMTTQTATPTLVNRFISTTPTPTLDFCTQTDPSLAKWRPMPHLSDTYHTMDVTASPPPMIDTASQYYLATLEQGVQAGGMWGEFVGQVGCQTELTGGVLGERERMAEMLRERCESLQNVVEGLEGQVAAYDGLGDNLELLEQANCGLRDELQKVQKIAHENNRKLSLRKHFDAEVERWIAEMRQQIELVNESVASAKDALEVNSGIQASAKSRIEELENEVELYKEIAVKHSAVDTDKNELSTPSSPEPWSPSHTPTSLSPVPETIHLDHSTVSNSLSLLPSPRSFISRFTMPRWTVPIFIYTVLIWNGGAAYGTLSMQSMMEAFAPLLYASGIIPTPSLFEGNAMREGYYGPGTPPIESCTPMTFLTGLFEGGGGQDLPPPL